MLLLAAAVLVAAAGCSSDGGSVETADVRGVGRVLVDGDGKVLYLFDPDQASEVTCRSTCARRWPPLKAAEGGVAVGDGVKKDLIGSVPSDVGSVVTYAGWPLYTFTADDRGEASGHRKDLNGGVWHAVAPDGTRAP